jgi:tRNA(Ile)-lysidine synthase TilS/MesJ
LLEITRSQTGQFCQEQKLPIWEDSTNQDLQYMRNRIRSELLPYLETHFNPKAQQALAQTAELLRADVEYLELSSQRLATASNVFNCRQSAGEFSTSRQVKSPDFARSTPGIAATVNAATTATNIALSTEL